LSDPAAGRIIVDVPVGWSVLGSDMIESKGAKNRFLMTIKPDEYSNFPLSAAPFKMLKRKETASCKAIKIYAGKYEKASLEKIAQSACSAAADLALFYCPIQAKDYTIITTPVSNSDAFSFYGGMAIKESNLRLSDTILGNHPALDMIITHELVHQYWGFGIMPQRGKRMGFVLESIPQFIAFKSGLRRGLVKETLFLPWLENAVRQKEKSVAALSPIGEVDDGDWQSYMRGPNALLKIDKLVPGGLERPLAAYYRDTFAKGKAIDPDHVIDAILIAVPEPRRKQAETILGTKLVR
jgi:hypothetical protein